MEFRADINGLRAIAVVAVLLYHFGLPGFGGGFVGVDIFFVISGYLMTGILFGRLDGGSRAIGTFYLARARRIVPALVVMCCAVLVLGWFWVAPLPYSQLAGHAAASVGFVSNIIYWKQVNYFNPDADTFWLLHTWSLSVEWQFYLLYPLALLALRRWLRITDERRTRNMLIAFGLGSMLAAVAAARFAPQGAFYLLPPRAWELLAGGVVCLSQRGFGASAATRRILVWAGLAAMAVSIASLDDTSPWATVLVAVPVAGTMLVLLGNQQMAVLDNRLFQALGRWSYSIYLWHWPIAVFLREWRPDAGPGLIAGAIGASVLLGWISFRLVESVSRERLRGARPWKQWATQAAAAVLVAGLGIEVVHARGHGERLPAGNAEIYRRYAAEQQHVAFPLACSVYDDTERHGDCDLGPSDAPHVLVFGDSHAQQWYAWWAEYAKSRPVHIEFYSREGCPVGFNAADRPFCVEFWRNALNYIRASNADAVIITSNWQVPDQVTRGSRPLELIRERLPELLAAARRDGRRTLVTLAMPKIGRSQPDQITARLFHNSPIDGLSRVDCAFFSQRAAEVNDDLREEAARAGAEVVDPVPIMCGADGQLRVVSDDRHLMFRDHNHVSTVASLHWGGAIFEPFVERLRPRLRDSSPSIASRGSAGK